MVESGCQTGEHSPDFPSGLDAEYQGSNGSQTKAVSFILLAVQIDALFLSPLPRLARSHREFSNFQQSRDLAIASIQTATNFLEPWPTFRHFPLT